MKTIVIGSIILIICVYLYLYFWPYQKNTFRIIPGQKTTEEVVAAGKYDYVTPSINSKNFPYRDRREGERKIVLLYFSYDASSDQVLAEAKRRGLVRPEYEDAFDFGKQFPEESRKHTIIFLHEPWQSLRGVQGIVVIQGDAYECNLILYDFDNEWTRCRYRFAFVQP